MVLDWSNKAVCGVVLLLAAPGNYRIDSKASFAEILIRFKDVIAKTETLAFWLFVIIAVVLILALLDKSRPLMLTSIILHQQPDCRILRRRARRILYFSMI